MISAAVRDTTSEEESPPRRRRRFGLDTPLPSDPRIIERAVLRHLGATRPDTMVVALARPKQAPKAAAEHVDLSAGVPDLLLLLPGGRAAFLAIRTQAQKTSRAERAFADLCRTRAVPVLVVRSLAEARQALDRLGVPSLPESPHANQESRVARRQPARASEART